MAISTIPEMDISSVRGFHEIDFVGDDFALFSDVSKLSFKEFPSRINASVLGLCLNGSCQVGVNLKEYTITPNMLIVTLPDQIIQNFGMSDDFSGLFIVISKGFVDDALPRLTELFPFLFHVKNSPSVLLDKEDVDCLIEYYSFLRKKVQMTSNLFRREIIKSILQSMFYDLYNIFKKHSLLKEVRTMSRKEELVERFLKEVIENYRTERTVMFYASKLCLTSKHLSGVVKEVSGKTAGEWIEDLVILEAKALLKSTEMSIQEVAETLHFSNQSFFGKYFKQHVGVSPKEYRK